MESDGKQAPRLRVAQLIESMAVGGAEHLAVKTANYLAAAGHDSHLIVTRGPDVLSAKIRPGVKVHYLHFERASIRNPWAFGTSLRKGLKLITEVIDGEQIPVVQTHLPGSNFFGLLLAWKKTCTVLATIHNNQEFYYGDADDPILFRLRKQAYRKILDTCQGVVAVSEEVRTSLIRDLGAGPDAAEKITVVTNAVEIPLPLDAVRRDAIRDDLGVGPEEILILAAGRFCEQKNFGDLVTAANKLKEKRCPFRLLIAGDGEQRADLADQVCRLGLEGEIALPGNLTDLDQIMQAADIFVMSSLWEGLPLVLLEAMAAGLPVVSYGIPGIEEVVSNGETGLIVTVGEPVSLAAGLERLVGDGELQRRLGAAGETRIRTDYGFSEYVDKLSGLYHRATEQLKGTKP
ncbi:MAG: hypothetical protein DRR04_13910 [Gammaproteobacteria bacterium]|nr:MAG: hypothetical protein DRR04_13910 [Gammaproteobacteria bacterium]